jgi:hypothetical protein
VNIGGHANLNANAQSPPQRSLPTKAAAAHLDTGECKLSNLNPTKADLRKLKGASSYASNMHPNPKLFKYYWRVFSNDCKFEGAKFFATERDLSTADFSAKIHELAARGESYIIYNRRLPRRFEGMPFDPLSERWRESQWAPAWEDDADPVHDGFK